MSEFPDPVQVRARYKSPEARNVAELKGFITYLLNEMDRRAAGARGTATGPAGAEMKTQFQEHYERLQARKQWHRALVASSSTQLRRILKHGDKATRQLAYGLLMNRRAALPPPQDGQ